MNRLACLLFLLPPLAVAPCASAGRADPGLAPAQRDSLEDARLAQARLGPGTWSRVIRVENTAPRRAYPATVYALVFEEAGLLWFYTDTDGTQSFTLHPARLAEEKADFAPLLRAIEPGFTAFEILPDDGERDSQSAFRNGPGGPLAGPARPLPNGCFVDSLAALWDRVQRGEPIERARLLSCYVDTPFGRRGHTVLTYETPRGAFLLDPGRSPEPRQVPRAWADDALALAGAALPGAVVAQARWVPTALPSRPPQVAALDDDSNPDRSAAPRLMR